MIKYCLFLILFAIACSSIKTGSVDNEISDTKVQIVDQPAGYKDSLLEIENLRSGLMKYESSLDEPITIGNKNQERYFSYAEAFDEKIQEQEETDCSHFSHEIYHRAGINFPYVNTTAIKCLKYFKEISNDQAKPGDLILYEKHIGIFSQNKKVISPGIGGIEERSKRLPTDSRFIPSIQELTIKSFGKPTFLRWSCQ